jgi:hypothetical protein
VSGETDLAALLGNLEPQLSPEEFVFSTIPAERLADFEGQAICTFREPEGITLILPRSVADQLGLQFTFPCRMITLRVHSSLEAVGLLARVATELADHGIAVNCVSGYYHDHLFVASANAERALQILVRRTSRSAAGLPAGE